MAEIVDFKQYNRGMAQAIDDKLWFLRHTEGTLVYVDYGCADGTMLRHMAETYPDLVFIGYDQDGDMVAAAMDNVRHLRNVFVTNEWRVVVSRLAREEGPKTLILSSLLHEVFSYSDRLEGIQTFLGRVFYNGFKHIAIRDMRGGKANYNVSDIDLARLQHRADPSYLKDFESIWGPITLQSDLLHYLLKYRFVENWKREVSENYLSCNPDRFLLNIPARYQIKRYDCYTLPWLYRKVREDFNIDLSMTHTHFKLLLENTERG